MAGRLVIKYCCVILVCLIGIGDGAGPAAKRAGQSYTVSDVLDDLDLHSDNRVRPGYGERPLEINAFAYIRNIIEINEMESTVTLNLLLLQIWDDPRVSFAPELISGRARGIKEILIDNTDFMSRLWNPDTFIVNEVKAHVCTGGHNLAHQIIRIRHNGSVLKTSRLTVTVSCPMRHKRYPFHNFECDIEMESFGHKTDDITFMWRNGSKSIDYSNVDTTSLAGKSSYRLESVESHSHQTYLSTGGSYSKLIIRLHFSKLWLRHALAFFIPTIILTFISISTLWIIHNGSLGVISNFIIAGLVVLFGSIEYSTAPLLTQVPFLTPVDIHLGICLSAVLSVLIFHAITLCLQKASFCITSVSSEDTQNQLKSAIQEKGSCVLKRHRSMEIESKKEIEEADNGEKFLTSRDIMRKVAEDNEVSYYESYDVTKADVEGGGEKRTSDIKDKAKTEEDDGNNSDKNLASSNSEGKCSSKVKILRGRFTGILRISLKFSKWITLVSFVVTEIIFWYCYLGTNQ